MPPPLVLLRKESVLREPEPKENQTPCGLGRCLTALRYEDLELQRWSLGSKPDCEHRSGDFLSLGGCVLWKLEQRGSRIGSELRGATQPQSRRGEFG